MTCIVGLVDNRGGVWIGGDSASSSNSELVVRRDPKVFTRYFHGERWAFGFTTSYRMGQLLQWSLDLPRVVEDRDLSAFMATDFVDEVRRCLKQGGWASRTNDSENGGCFVVGVRGRLFVVHEDYSIMEAEAPIIAVGRGADVALGAMHVLVPAGLEPKTILKAALEASEAWNTTVRAPFRLVHT